MDEQNTATSSFWLFFWPWAIALAVAAIFITACVLNIVDRRKRAQALAEATRRYEQEIEAANTRLRQLFSDTRPPLEAEKEWRKLRNEPVMSGSYATHYGYFLKRRAAADVKALYEQHVPRYYEAERLRNVRSNLAAWRRDRKFKDAFTCQQYLNPQDTEAAVGITSTALELEIRTEITQRRDRLVGQKPSSMVQLQDFRSLRETVHKYRRELVQELLPYPPEWNQWVAELVELPCLSDFTSVPPYADLPQGSLRKWAAELLTVEQPGRKEFTDAKVILAYCNVRSQEEYHWSANYRANVRQKDEAPRRELGELAGELAKLVARLAPQYGPRVSLHKASTD